MSAPKQATLNEHVNLEAIGAYADRLARGQKRIEKSSWLHGLTEVQVAALAALAAAETALREAYDLCVQAERVRYDEAAEPATPTFAPAVLALLTEPEAD